MPPITKTEIEKKIKELENKQTKLQEEINILKQAKIENKQERWKPELYDRYYYVGSDGDAYSCYWHNDKVDNWHYLNNNVFKTEQNAMEYIKKIEIQAQFEDFVKERNDELDWEDDTQCKYYLYYNYYLKQIMIGMIWVCKYPFQVFASSEQILRDAIKELGENNVKKYILEVEE